jgi:hypothetical protein
MRSGKITFPKGPLMSSRVRAHLRNNLVGYIALFCFAMGGTAYATHPGGEKTISSVDIIDGEVFSDDVANDTVAGGGLAAADLAPNSVGTSEVAPDSLISADLATNSVGSTEIIDGEVKNPDLGSNSVTGPKVASSSLTGSDIANDSLSSLDIGPNAVGTSEHGTVPGARASSNAAQTIANSTNVTVALDEQEFDTGGLYTAPNDSMTVSVPGTYALSAEVGFNPDPDGARAVRIMVDGSPVAVTHARATSTPYPTRIPTSTIARLSAGDVVTIQASHNAGSSLATATYVPVGHAYLAVQWLSD